jgi:hypothetical protein
MEACNPERGNMTIKYKLGFTIDSETLFGIMAKFLPIENLSVEEVVERPAPDPAIRFDKRFDLPKPKRTNQRKYGGQVDLTLGVNAVIMGVLSDRQAHTYREMRDAIAKTVYSPNGIGSRLERLVAVGYVTRLGGGKYRASSKALPVQENVA